MGVLIDREQGGAARMASNGLTLHSAFTLSFILQVRGALITCPAALGRCGVHSASLCSCLSWDVQPPIRLAWLSHCRAHHAHAAECVQL